MHCYRIWRRRDAEALIKPLLVSSLWLHPGLRLAFKRCYHTLCGALKGGIRGLEPALSLISELVYGVAPSYRDPVRYTFAHGGKDGIPYPVDRKTYDQSIELLGKAISKSKLGIGEKRQALKRLDGVRIDKK